MDAARAAGGRRRLAAAAQRHLRTRDHASATSAWAAWVATAYDGGPDTGAGAAARLGVRGQSSARPFGITGITCKQGIEPDLGTHPPHHLPPRRGHRKAHGEPSLLDRSLTAERQHVRGQVEARVGVAAPHDVAAGLVRRPLHVCELQQRIFGIGADHVDELAKALCGDTLRTYMPDGRAGCLGECPVASDTSTSPTTRSVSA